MATFLLTWNPAYWNGMIRSPIDWTCGNSKRIKRGDRLFLIRQGTEPRGIVAAGHALTDVFLDEDTVLRTRMEIDTFLDPECEEIFPRDQLAKLNEGLDQPMNWSARLSGNRIPDAVAERLELAWQAFLAGRPAFADEVLQAGILKEGAVRRVIVNAYERNPEARRRCIEHHGRACCICGFDFGRIYGPSGAGIVHVHHLKALSEVAAEYEIDPVQDLRPVCPNCHAVIHRRSPAYSLEEVRSFLRRDGNTVNG